MGRRMIQDLKCQACGKKFTVRRDTVLYRLKSRSDRVCQVLGLMAEGVDISTLERVLGVGEGTMRTWLTRAGQHAERMHNAVFEEVEFRHIQLDELWANVKRDAQEVSGVGSARSADESDTSDDVGSTDVGYGDEGGA